MTEFDVAVIGAGICGAACALELTQRGASVLLLDRGEVSGATTGLGEGNVLVSDKRPGPELELALAGRALWDELDARFPDAARVRRKGGLVVFDGEGAGEFAERIAAHGVACEVVDDPRAVEPALAPGLAPAVLVPGELQVDPRSLTRALAREAVRAGATVREHTEVVAVGGGYASRTGTDGVRLGRGRGASVTLAAGEPIAAAAVVLAAGPWSAALAASAGLHLPVEPRKGQLVALAAPAGMIRRKLYEASYMDTIESPDAGLQVAAVIEQTLASDEVLVGSSRERVGFDTAVDDAVNSAMRARAARFVPAVATLPQTRAWVGLRPWLADGLPAIGPSEHVPDLHVCTGHEGAGVALGPISGRLVAQLIAGEKPAVDPTPFAPDRFGEGLRRDESQPRR